MELNSLAARLEFLERFAEERVVRCWEKARRFTLPFPPGALKNEKKKEGGR